MPSRARKPLPIVQSTAKDFDVDLTQSTAPLSPVPFNSPPKSRKRKATPVTPQKGDSGSQDPLNVDEVKWRFAVLVPGLPVQYSSYKVNKSEKQQNFVVTIEIDGQNVNGLLSLRKDDLEKFYAHLEKRPGTSIEAKGLHLDYVCVGGLPLLCRDQNILCQFLPSDPSIPTAMFDVEPITVKDLMACTKVINFTFLLPFLLLILHLLS